MDFTGDGRKTHDGAGKGCERAPADLALDILRYYGFCAQLLELAAISRSGDKVGERRRALPAGGIEPI
jgi:hypothetical protein